MDLSELTATIKKEFPDFSIVQKSESRFMKVLDVLLKIITFWQLRTFMTSFTTTVGDTIYVPDKWDSMPESSKVRVLRHELVHLRQKKKYTAFGFGFLYLFFPFPIGVAYFRMKFEREAYEETLRALAEVRGVEYLRLDKKAKEWMVKHFVGADYFWMWPFRSSVERWYDEVLERLEAEGL